MKIIYKQPMMNEVVKMPISILTNTNETNMYSEADLSGFHRVIYARWILVCSNVC
jgi:hypothetical protein